MNRPDPAGLLETPELSAELGRVSDALQAIGHGLTLYLQAIGTVIDVVSRAAAELPAAAAPRVPAAHELMQDPIVRGVRYYCRCGWDPRRLSIPYHPHDDAEAISWVAVHIDTAKGIK